MTKKNKAPSSRTPKILADSKFSPLSFEVVKSLKKAGYQAYLVGGCVRDLLVGIKAKDFDVSTNATPEQVRKIFRSSRIIGKRFRLVHVFSRNELIEVSTFRADASKTQNNDGLVKDTDGKILRDNVWGSLEEDCVRRDFSINALYFDPVENVLHDFHNGIEHIQKKSIVSIGDPMLRFEEDPVRSLRAIRFSSKLGFKISGDIKEAIYKKAPFLEIFLMQGCLMNFVKSFFLKKHLIILKSSNHLVH